MLVHVHSSTMSMIQGETLVVKSITARHIQDNDGCVGGVSVTLVMGEWAGSLV